MRSADQPQPWPPEAPPDDPPEDPPADPPDDPLDDPPEDPPEPAADGAEDEPLTVMAAPEGAISHHLAPNESLPWPVVFPALVSASK